MAKKTNNPTPDKSSNSGQKAKESFKKVGEHFRDGVRGGVDQIISYLADCFVTLGDKVGKKSNSTTDEATTDEATTDEATTDESTQNIADSGRINRTKEELSDFREASKNALSGTLNALCGGAKYLGYKGMLKYYGNREEALKNKKIKEEEEIDKLQKTDVKKKSIKIPADDKEVDAKDLVVLPDGATAEFEGTGIDKNSALDQKVMIVVKLGGKTKRIEIIAKIGGKRVKNITISKIKEENGGNNSKVLDEINVELETIKKRKEESELGKQEGKQELPQARVVFGDAISAGGHLLKSLSVLTSVDEQARNRNIQNGKYWEVVRETIKGTGGGLRKSLKGVGGTFGNTAKGVWYGIDVADKKIGKKIEGEKGKKRGEKLKLLRDNILKGILIALLAGVGTYEFATSGKEDGKNSIEINDQRLTEKEKSAKNFFTSVDVNKIEDFKSPGKKLQDERENKYLGKNDVWNKMSNGDEQRKQLIMGMCRMIESEVKVKINLGGKESEVMMSHLDMVIQKAIEAGVPIQSLYVALAESCWNANADSGVARGYWQFTKDTARRYGLIDEKGNDYRSDPVKSTEAAMRHLRDNYDQVSNYASKRGYNISESDKWIFAFFMFNGSPGLIKAGMDACKGDVNKYSDALVALAEKNHGKINGIKVDAKQNANYVPRILAIQDALVLIFGENGYYLPKIKSMFLDEKIEKIENTKKTSADIMYQEYLANKDKYSIEDAHRKLREIEDEYENEWRKGLISKTYLEGARDVIVEEIRRIEGDGTGQD